MDRIQQRFDDLDTEANAILQNKTSRQGCIDYPVVVGGPRPTAPQIPDVDRSLLTKWQLSVGTLFDRVFSPDDSVRKSFLCLVENCPRNLNADWVDYFQQQIAVFRSAKESYEGGYLFDVKNLIHAEVFSDELEQAEHFLSGGYKAPAAVTAGVVLETTLRKLCDQTEDVEPADKLNKMNDDLAKAGVYNKMRADQVRAWAKIRNDAAHGHPEEFDKGDVERMIAGVRDFVANQLS